ncbi:MAG: FprA family A-type flavoprotein [Lachnospiraceae bacterium]|nr:FprA family A-type flavoprotein [Lachnospiraceae bacterium]
MKYVSKNIVYVGVNDREIDLFEGQYPVPDGISYNSYMILDETIAVMDSVDAAKTKEWLSNIEEALGGRKPDFLVVQHMEPDHSASIAAFVNKYDSVTIVGNARTFAMISQFFPELNLMNTLEVKDGEQLKLGVHTLQFVFAPMVHWPEVMMVYELSEKVLFSADGFGKFGAWEEGSTEDWADEAGRYYIGIVGKYGAQVQNVLKKAASLDVKTICPLHGPVLSENLEYYLRLYDLWSSYQPQKSGVCICYASVYGHTGEAARLLAEKLKERGTLVVCHDLNRGDWSKAVADAFCYDRLVLASITYNGEIFPSMKGFLGALTERGYRGRKVAFIENGTWAPVAYKVMASCVEKWKDITLAENHVTIRSAINEAVRAQLDTLAEELSE